MKRCDESEKMRRDASKIRQLLFDFVPRTGYVQEPEGGKGGSRVSDGNADWGTHNNADWGTHNSGAW